MGWNWLAKLLVFSELAKWEACTRVIGVSDELYGGKE